MSITQITEMGYFFIIFHYKTYLFLGLNLALDLSYKEIKRLVAYPPESLLGNTGGFIGIFVGYSFLGKLFQKV